jgi:hypothetical protein
MSEPVSDLPACGAPAPQAEYARFDNEADYQLAVDRLLALPGRELRVFDPELSTLRLTSSERIELLQKFLLASCTRRIYIAVHQTDWITARCPRMMNLLARFSHVIQINRTQEEIRNIQDSFLVLDARHYVRRPVAALYRGAIGIDDETEALVMRARFHEIWESSYPGVSSTTVGL